MAGPAAGDSVTALVDSATAWAAVAVPAINGAALFGLAVFGKRLALDWDRLS